MLSGSIQTTISELEDGLGYFRSGHYRPVHKEEIMRILSSLFQLVFRLDNPRATEEEASALECAGKRWSNLCEDRESPEGDGTRVRPEKAETHQRELIQVLEQEWTKQHAVSWEEAARELADQLVEAKEQMETLGQRAEAAEFWETKAEELADELIIAKHELERARYLDG
jgi:hypothetical protein